MPSAEPPHRHNNGPLSEDDARKLSNHIRALEVLDEQAQDIRDDRKVRKEMAKKDGFDGNVVEAIIKRRKAGDGETKLADMLVRIYEEGLQDEGVLPLEQTRVTPEPRRSLEEISQSVHGRDLGAAAPPGKETAEEAAERAIREFRERFPNVTVTMGEPSTVAPDPPDQTADPF